VVYFLVKVLEFFFHKRELKVMHENNSRQLICFSLLLILMQCWDFFYREVWEEQITLSYASSNGDMMKTRELQLQQHKEETHTQMHATVLANHCATLAFIFRGKFSHTSHSCLFQARFPGMLVWFLTCSFSQKLHFSTCFCSCTFQQAPPFDLTVTLVDVIAANIVDILNTNGLKLW